MKLFPTFLVRLTDRALAKVPTRYRPAARYAVILSAVAFLAFELSRVWIGFKDYLLPSFAASLGRFGEMVSSGQWVGIAATALIFSLQFALAVWVFRRVMRMFKPA